MPSQPRHESIQLLSEVVAAQIAAGEVVERPASVVKELLENALDAGARSIRIEIEGGGRRLIRITDDGSGIPTEETELAFLRHATSKLRSIDDLDTIQTLGFRGEALASVASVAQVTLITRTEAEIAGTLLRVDGGKVIEHSAAGSPGTVITVENLFFNTPARLRFLKAEATERRHIDTIVTRYAMAYPNVRFTLAQDGRVTFGTSGSGDLADVLVEALGLDIMREMIEVSPLEPHRADLPRIAVYGFTSAPALNRNTRSHIILFVNGRNIQDTSLAYAASQAYHTMMPADRYPIAVLMITLSPSDVDVNVHPTKAEVRFRSPDAVFSAVQRAVRKAVITQAGVPSAGIGNAPQEDPRPWRAVGMENEPPYPNPALNPPPFGKQGVERAEQTDRSDGQLDLDLPDYDAGRYTQQIPGSNTSVQPYQRPSNLPPAPNPADFTLPDEVRPRSLPPMRVVGQAAATYIIAEGPAGLYLVDQHAAHERILYEQFMRDQAKQRPIAQYTLEPVTVRLAPDALRMIEANFAELQAVGFEIEPFGGNMIRVRAVPAVLSRRDPAEAITSILEDLEVGAEPTAPTVEANITLRVCKAAAVKAGQTLSYEDMVSLMKQLERCESPRSCPHGRPTMIHISQAQLAKEFGRI